MSMQNVEDVYALSPMQEGMLYHTIREPGSGAFVEQYCCTLEGDFDVPAFKTAWAETLRRHPALRTAFLWDGLDEPLQVVRRDVELPWTMEDWRSLVPHALELRWEQFLRADRARGLDLSRAPVMRGTLVRVAAREWRFVWTFHHVVSDGWSTPLVLGDVFSAYAARRSGEPARLSTPRPYREYIAWLQSQDMAPAKAFWEADLAGVSEPTSLAIDGIGRPRRQGYARHYHELNREDTRSLADTARRLRVTLNTLVQGAWALLLHRYSGATEVVYGTTDAGRPAALEGVEQMIGLFICTLPVRARVHPSDDVATWLRRLQSYLAELRQFAHTPLVDIQRASGVPAGSPLFESIVVFENYPTPPSLATDIGLEVRDVRYIEQSNFPLALLVVPDETLRFIVVYDTARFDEGAIARMAGHLETLLEGLVADPEARLVDVPMLTEAERETLLRDWNPAEVERGGDGTVLDLIAEQARRRPDRTAVVFEDQSLTYRDLLAQADRVAKTLRASGVGPDEPVGLYTNRSLAMVVGVLGILRSGAAYVPLDPDYPAQRLQFMLEDAGAQVLLAEADLVADLSEAVGTVLVLEEVVEGPGPAEPLPAVKPDSLAYVIYTSGSTGTPKGVQVTHRNLTASTTARFAHYREPVEAFLLLSSHAFDSSVAGLFWTLTTGGNLVLPPARQEQDLDGLAALIARRAVTHTLMLPSLYGLLLEGRSPGELESLRVVIVAGEECPAQVVARHHRLLPAVALHNEYGPTEATVWCAVRHTEPTDAEGPVPIGRPIEGVRLYVLDAEGRPVPIGVPGELYVGGSGVARGYLNRPESTRERFVAPPSAAFPDERLYRTGDVVRYRDDGVLDFLGRADDQVKIRGHRIEPGEIAAVLKLHSTVRDAVVTAQRDDGGLAARLVAYVVADPVVDPQTWREFLRSRLPGHMWPASFVRLDALPRLPNGKVDLGALPAPEEAAAGATVYTEPRSAEEKALAAVWAEVLGVDRVGVHDHFFELGGDSILSIQVISRARQAGLALAPVDLFEHPTIAELAELVESGGVSQAEQGTVAGRLPLLPIQHWFFDTHSAAAHHWNQAFWLDAPPDTDPAALRRAVRDVVEHHDALRTAFQRTPHGWSATIVAAVAAVPFEHREATVASLEDQDLAIEDAAVRFQSDFDLSRPPLFRVVLFGRGSERPARILVAAHHLVVDAVSWSILLEDLAAAYQAARRGDAPQLPAKTTSSMQWAEHLSAQAERSSLRAEIPYWNAQIAGAASLPVDHQVAPPATEATARTVTVQLDTDDTRALMTSVHKAYNTRINDLLLTALGRALAAWTGSATLHLELEAHGRRAVAEGGEGFDLSRTVGWFTAAFPLALTLPSSKDPGTAIKAIKEQLRGVPNEGLGYGLLRYLSIDGSLGLGPEHRSSSTSGSSGTSPELLFNYLGNLDLARPDPAPFRISGPARRSARSPMSERPYRLEINASVSGSRLRVEWTYDGRAYGSETVEGLAHRFLESLRSLIDHCTTGEAGGYTPSDFPESGLGQRELDQFLDALG